MLTAYCVSVYIAYIIQEENKVIFLDVDNNTSKCNFFALSNSDDDNNEWRNTSKLLKTVRITF